MEIHLLDENTLIAAIIIVALVCWTAGRAWRQLIRHLNIRDHGWPPPHVDADGETTIYHDAWTKNRKQ